jgi:hypothetical protein
MTIHQQEGDLFEDAVRSQILHVETCKSQTSVSDLFNNARN